MIKATIIKDSVYSAGQRLTTYLLVYPRFIHSEFMTHRTHSRNASSSRAIPFKRQMKAIFQDMAKPIAFLSNKPGMQGGNRLPFWKEMLAFGVWKTAGFFAILFAYLLNKLGAHKQYVNRVTEPFAHITVVATATEESWNHFFSLRFHPDAQPEFALLAQRAHLEYVKHTPQKLKRGQWHLPFVDEIPEKVLGSLEISDWMPYIEKSVAACARTSYNNHDGTAANPEKDKKLHDDLKNSNPMHASPFEHQAKAPLAMDAIRIEMIPYQYLSNLKGWIQYRKLIPGEFIPNFTKPLKPFKK